MLIVRFQKDDSTYFGHLDGDRVGLINGGSFGEFVRGPLQWPLDEVKLLPPCQPSKIIAIGHNFADRVREMGIPAPELPAMFFKAPSAIIGQGDAIRLPPQSQHVEHGAELGIVIGRQARWLTPETAPRHILGYTCANDVIALDLARQDGAWTRGSSFDTFCPLGPAIATSLDPTELIITCSVNGVTQQMSSTHDLIFSVPQLVAYVSSVMTLLPGDLILSGSPAGAGPIVAGDVVEVEIEGIGKLSNPVLAEESQP